MCGLVGVLGTPSYKNRNVFEDMLQMDVVRGPDSTGIAAIGRKHARIHKAAVLPTDLIESEIYNRALSQAEKKSSYLCLIGHNRKATKGEIVAKNAHPFNHGSIILAHNGTLTSTYDLPGDKQFETDSETLAFALNELGIHSLWKKIYGAATIVWWDTKTDTLNMISNGQRSLFFASVDEGKGLIWASEPWTIIGASTRRTLTIDAKLTMLSDDVLYTFAFKKDKPEITKREEKILRYEWKNHHRSAYRGPWEDDEDMKPKGEIIPFVHKPSGGDGSAKGSANSVAMGLVTRKDILNRSNSIKKDITPKEFEEFKFQCFMCNEVLGQEDYSDCIFIDDDNIICTMCSRTAIENNMPINSSLKGA